MYAFIASAGVIYTVWCLSELHIDKNVFKNNLCFQRKRKKAQIGTNVRVLIFNAGLLARIQFTSGRC
jgi:hypothetical protein